MLNKDKVWIGLIIGFRCAVCSLWSFTYSVYDQLDNLEITDPVGMGDNYRQRTVGLLAIAANIIPINIFKRRYEINKMRGIMMATMVYVVLWLYMYYQYFRFINEVIYHSR